MNIVRYTLVKGQGKWKVAGSDGLNIDRERWKRYISTRGIREARWKENRMDKRRGENILDLQTLGLEERLRGIRRDYGRENEVGRNEW